MPVKQKLEIPKKEKPFTEDLEKLLMMTVQSVANLAKKVQTEDQQQGLLRKGPNIPPVFLTKNEY